jgi:hypothetical protein
MIPKLMTKRLYRSVFGSLEGQRVLAHLLTDMKFFADNLHDSKDIAVAEYAKTILRRCGIFPDDPKDAPKVELLVQTVFGMPYEEEE